MIAFLRLWSGEQALEPGESGLRLVQARVAGGPRDALAILSLPSPTLGDAMAWELVVRYSMLDLDSAASRGGVQADWNFGATWYLNSYARLMANYVVSDSRRRGVNDDPRLFLMRVQLQF
jgi:hypothetical protein